MTEEDIRRVVREEMTAIGATVSITVNVDAGVTDVVRQEIANAAPIFVSAIQKSIRQGARRSDHRFTL